jgi:hypothetical protein
MCSLWALLYLSDHIDRMIPISGQMILNPCHDGSHCTYLTTAKDKSKVKNAFFSMFFEMQFLFE